jgi:transposase
MRAVINAILYRVRARCAWRMLPRDFPHWRTVYGYFRQWQQDGTWKKIEQFQSQWRSESRQPANGHQGGGLAVSARPQVMACRDHHRHVESGPPCLTPLPPLSDHR